MSFQHPAVLVALLALPLGALAYLLHRRRHPPASLPFPDLDVVASATSPARLRRFLPLGLVGLALVGLVVALARPEVSRAVPKEQATIMLAIDVSGSMAATDVEPYRLRAAQDAAERFADRVPRQYRVGLVSFSGEANVLLPPTTDRVQFRNAVETLRADGATAIGDAIERSLEAIRSVQPGSERLQSARILLLSDGANTTGTTVADAAQHARQAGVPVSTVALGTQGGVLPNGRQVPPDPDALRGLAKATGGTGYESRDAESLSAVYTKLGRFIGTTTVRDEVTGWPAGIAALLLALGCVAGWRFGPRLP